jgi:uncharacterized protein DUF4231
MPSPSETTSVLSKCYSQRSENTRTPSEQVTLDRLSTQIDWYECSSKINKVSYKSLKTITLVAATAIPVLTTASIAHGSQLAAALGVLITVLEAIQQMNQYHANWIAYRATAESLKHEKYLYLGAAGIYSRSANPPSLLAERVELLVSQENGKWLTGQTQAGISDPAAPARVA